MVAQSRDGQGIPLQAIWTRTVVVEVGVHLCGHFDDPDVHGGCRCYVMGCRNNRCVTRVAAGNVGDCVGTQFEFRADQW